MVLAVLPSRLAESLLLVPDPRWYPVLLQATWLGYPNTTGVDLLNETLCSTLAQ